MLTGALGGRTTIAPFTFEDTEEPGQSNLPEAAHNLGETQDSNYSSDSTIHQWAQNGFYILNG